MNDPNLDIARTQQLLKLIVHNAVDLLDCVGLKDISKRLDRIPIDPPELCDLLIRTLMAADTMARMRWGLQGMQRGTVLSHTVMAISVASIAVTAVRCSSEMPVWFLQSLIKSLER